MLESLQTEINEALRRAGIAGNFEFTAPPRTEMGDLALACFGLAKEWRKSPVEAAQEIESKIKNQASKIFDDVQTVGPYVNFVLNGSWLADHVLGRIEQSGRDYGAHRLDAKQTNLVEYACPNPLKTFHLGHLRNLVSGESVARILANAGYTVVRVNYQGDVGLHVAKALWAIRVLHTEYAEIRQRPLTARVEFLGRAYAYGASRYETDEQATKEIDLLNEKIYEQDAAILELYRTTRAWSLEYFEAIYERLGTKFDRLYFESEMAARAVAIVKTNLAAGIFQASEGAVIFPGKSIGLHDRVFLNSKGYPTYEAKDLALAERHASDYRPDKIIHVVGKEQTEYFKVVFAALGRISPALADKEHHLIGGYLQLRGNKKMSSRAGNVIAGDELLLAVEKRVRAIMKDVRLKNKRSVVRAVSAAALKYALLKTGVSDDIAFDMEASVSTAGDSGPYLLYMVARIASIIRKSEAEGADQANRAAPAVLAAEEKNLLLQLAEFGTVTARAAEQYNPAIIAQFLFRLAQTFTAFYHACPVLSAPPSVREFRLRLLRAVAAVMGRGLWLLGLETVAEM